MFNKGCRTITCFFKFCIDCCLALFTGKKPTEDACVYVCCTLISREIAVDIVKELLENKLVACASLFPLTSLFIWKGKLTEENESKVIFKTTASCFQDIVKCIRKRSGYEITEIVLLPISDINPEYAAWVRESTARKDRE